MKSSINAIRILAADMIQKANSGHPGLPLGAADIGYELFANQLKHNPKEPEWINRDRFVLSAGHGSALLYSLLHLFSYEGMSIDEIKQFRQENSITPGHPEYKHTIGVEATTGPLGAGLGMAVGMAMSQEHMAKKFNKENFPVFDHYTYAFCGDGCLMEGISAEAMSLAGMLELGKLIVIYDSNDITIEGSTDITFTEDIKKRFESFGFETFYVEDGNNIEQVAKAIEQAKKNTTKPSFIECKTKIGYGVPAKEGSASSHGEPLGVENVKALRETLKWEYDEAFYVPDEVYNHYNELSKKGEQSYQEWCEMFKLYEKTHPELKKLLDEYYEDMPNADILHDEKYWVRERKEDATRTIAGNALNYIKDLYPNLLGGSADLAPSNKVTLIGEADFKKGSYEGRNIHYGVREIAMTAVANGIALYGPLRTFIATFFVFSDYMKPMLRLSALMGLPVISVLTHDSIGVGEDGPTHQPVEQLAMLRSLPDINIFRPADEIETKVAWCSAINSKDTPTCIILSRQNLPYIENTSKQAFNGAYIVEKEQNEEIDMIFMATGSELSIAISAKQELEKQGKSIRVVSMPCMEIFEKQSDEYKEQILPKNVRKRIAVEAGSGISWGRYVGLDGKYITMDTFGESANANVMFKKFGFTCENLVKTALELINE